MNNQNLFHIDSLNCKSNLTYRILLLHVISRPSDNGYNLHPGENTPSPARTMRLSLRQDVVQPQHRSRRGTHARKGESRTRDDRGIASHTHAQTSLHRDRIEVSLRGSLAAIGARADGPLATGHRLHSLSIPMGGTGLQRAC